MNPSARLLTLSTALGAEVAPIYPKDAWPNKAPLVSWLLTADRKRWTDFISATGGVDDFNANLGIFSGRVVADLLEAGFADGHFVPLDMHESPILYFAFHPRAKIRMRTENISAKRGYSEPVLADVPDYEGYEGHAFVTGVKTRYGDGPLLCIPAILELAKAKRWTGVSIDGFDDGGTLYECNDRGKITKDHTGPRSCILDGYYVSEDVIAADLVRARELAAELQSSPDTPEWTRRSFEIVRKALVEAPHTLGYPIPKAAKPRRVSDPSAPLIDPKALKRLKLEGEGELVGEIELGRPLFGSDTLSVIVSDEVCDDDAPEVSFTKTEMKSRAKVALEKLESRLPAIEAAIDQLATADEKSPANFRVTLHDPGVFLCTVDMAEGERWTFTVEDDLVAHHFEFDGDKLIETWAGD